MSNCIEMRVQAGSQHIFSAQRLSCVWQRRGKLHLWAINLWTCWETKNCSELQSIARLVNFNCVLMQLIAPCNRALRFSPGGCISSFEWSQKWVSPGLYSHPPLIGPVPIECACGEVLSCATLLTLAHF